MLEKYSSVFSTVGSLATLPLLLSPSLICRDFIRKGNSDHIKPIVFVGGLMRCVLFFRHGLLMNVQAIAITHSVGIALYAIYTTLYVAYSKEKGKVFSSLFKATLLVTLLLLYSKWESPKLVANRFGIMVTTVHLSLLAVPLLSLKHIIKSKSTATLPFPIIFCAHIVSVMWLLFGISVHNSTIVWQMLIGVALTGFQLSLFVIYPSKKTEKKSD